MKTFAITFAILTYIIGQNIDRIPKKELSKPDRKVIKLNRDGYIWLMNNPVKGDKFAEFNLGDSTSVLATKNSIISINRDVEVSFFNGVSMVLPPRIMMKIQDAFEKTIMLELTAKTTKTLNLLVGEKTVTIDLKPMRPFLLVVATRSETEAVTLKDNTLIIKVWDPIVIDSVDKTPPMMVKIVRIMNVSNWVTLHIGGKEGVIITGTTTMADGTVVATTERDQASPTQPN